MYFLYFIILSLLTTSYTLANDNFFGSVKRPVADENFTALLFEVHPELNFMIDSNKKIKDDNDKQEKKIQTFLLTGSPRLGKTLAAYIVAQKLGSPATFIRMDQIDSDSADRAMQELDEAFSEAATSKKHHTVIIDDIDKLSGKHDGTPIMHLCDIIDANRDREITIIATTNNLKNIAEPLQNQFKNGIIEFHKITNTEREKILKYFFGRVASPEIMTVLKREFTNMSINEICMVLRETKKNACENNAGIINGEILQNAIDKIRGGPCEVDTDWIDTVFRINRIIHNNLAWYIDILDGTGLITNLIKKRDE